MKSIEATRRVVFHSQPESGAFVDMLRPYKGLREEVLQDLLDALRFCADELGREEVNRELMSALWAISYLGRSWALDPGGMLQANKLISQEDEARLRDFIDRLDFAVMVLLDGGDVDSAFSR